MGIVVRGLGSRMPGGDEIGGGSLQGLPLDFQQLWLHATGALPSLHGAPESQPAAVVPGLGDNFKYWGDAPLAVDQRILVRYELQELLALERFLTARSDLYDAQASFMEAVDPLRGRASRLWVDALETLREHLELEINSRFGGLFYQDVDG